MSKPRRPTDPEDLVPDAELEDLTAEAPAAPVARAKPERHLVDDLDPTESQSAAATEDAPSAAMAGALLDPEQLAAEATDEEIEEAKDLDLSQFRGHDRVGDAFEDWIQASRAHGFLTAERTAMLLVQAHSADPEQREEATDLLVRHNVNWILTCLKRTVGAQMISQPSDLRDDLLSTARLGFLDAIDKYDPEKAQERSKSGHQKSFLGYVEIRVKKRVLEYLDPERFGMNKEAAYQRKRAIEAREALRREAAERRRRPPTAAEIRAQIEEDVAAALAARNIEATPEALRANGTPTEAEVAAAMAQFADGISEDEIDDIENDFARELLRNVAEARLTIARKGVRGEPTAEEIAAYLTRQAYNTLAQRGNGAPTPKQLNRVGMMDAERVQELLDHSTSKVSLDAPAGASGEEDGPTVAEMIKAEKAGQHESMEHEEKVKAADRLLEIATSVRDTQAARLALGASPRTGPSETPHEVYNPEEVASYFARVRDTIDAMVERVRLDLRGEKEVNVDLLRPVGTHYTVGMLKAAEGVVDPAIRAEIRARVDLPELVKGSGKRLIRVAPRGQPAYYQGACPFEPESRSTSNFTVSAERYCCSGCGQEGDVFAWLEQAGRTPAEALVEAGILSLRIARTAISSKGTVVATTDPVKKKNVLAHR